MAARTDDVGFVDHVVVPSLPLFLFVIVQSDIVGAGGAGTGLLKVRGAVRRHVSVAKPPAVASGTYGCSRCTFWSG